MRGLYIHVPFCVKKCSYCDFYSLAGRGDSGESYIGAILRESSGYAGHSFQTLYIGGGTPSLLGPKLLHTLISGVRESFDLSGLVEASMEVNPDSASRELLETAGASGINRLSIGVQSLSDSELQSVGRAHTAAQAIDTVRLARSLGLKSLSVDLIVGLPGQTWPSLHHSLKTLIALGIDHLSLYCLSIEDSTPLAKNIPDNLPSDDLQAELFNRAASLLTDQGFTHYEISNFSRSGHDCLHNLIYWHGEEYLGLGTAAASHLDGKRFKNGADLDRYIREPTGQIEYVEKLDLKEKASEEAMLRLRLLKEGLDVETLATRFGTGNIAALTVRLDAMAKEGMLKRKGPRYRLNPARVLTSNQIFEEVISPAS